ncbi:MAG: AraC family transcriptional regulator [Planctomycetes bacterium]|nr:AraC family transcriptional regulator [Planctomycetota bacterium]
MSQSIIVYDKINHLAIHTLPEGEEDIHCKYGLWICQAYKAGRHQPLHDWQYRYFEFFCISHLIEGAGRLITPDGTDRNFAMGDAVIVSPGFVHRYGGNNDIYCEDVICFAGPIAERLVACNIINNGIVHIGKGRRLLPIIDMAISPSEENQIRANIALQKLLVDIYSENVRKRRPSALSKLLDEIQVQYDKWWTVPEMAAFCHLSENQFRRVFQKETGLSPKHYIERLKMKFAGMMLAEGGASILEVAEKLGYGDQFHFSRRFKHIVGVSPKEYKEKTKSLGGSY